MRFAFHKMHGLGNDFVVIDARSTPFAVDTPRARAICDRHRGIGCDQLILIEPSTLADVRMRIFNADGSEVEQCGNALRCVATLIGGDPSIETAGGLIQARATVDDVIVDIGEPRFDWEAIPLAYAMDTMAMPVAWDRLEQPSAVNVGNPHLIFFVDDIAAIDLARLGAQIATDPLFPDGINVNVATIVDRHATSVRVWERGAGLTQACGTGACATAVAAIRCGLATSPVTVSLPGGDLTVEWREGATIVMRGPATHVFDGVADL